MKKFKTLNFREFFDIFHKVITIFALIIGGFWTYKLFIEQREPFQKAQIRHHISHFNLSKNLNLVRLVIDIENKGSVLLEIRKGTVVLEEVSLTPAVENDSKQIKGGTIKWNLIKTETIDYEEGEFIIEPGVSETIDFEFIIASDYKVVKVRSSIYVSDKLKSSGEPYRWITSTLYDLSDEGDNK